MLDQNITLFQQQFEQSEVRFVSHPEGKYEFGIVATDLANVLEHSNSRALCESIEDEWKGVSNVYTLGGTQAMTVIWEPGVYQLVATSRKPKAKPFQRWLYEEVLPSIRKTGSYSKTKMSREELIERFGLPSNYLEALHALASAEEERLRLVARLEQQAPLVKLSETLTTKDVDVVSIGDLAKAYGIGRTTFFDVLRDVGFIMQPPSRLPYQKHLDAGRAEVIRKERAAQPGVFDSVTVLTAKGQEYIAKKLEERERAIATEVAMESVVDFEDRKLAYFAKPFS